MIDAIISTLSPKWALERDKYRRAQKILSQRKYDGAAKGRRTDGWISTSNDSNVEVYSGLVTLRNRSRELIRNNSYAVSAQSVVVNNVIGDGIVGQVNAEANKETELLSKLFNDWCNSKSADADGRFNFYGLQALIEGSRFESGEVIVRRIYPKSGEYKFVPFKIQVLESDFLDVDKSEDLPSGGRIIQGIEVDRTGKTVSYWLFSSHPGSGKASKSSKVPAVDIIHYLRRKRPGQMRSVPDLTPVMITLNDLDGYQDAQLLKQKISTCFTAFVTKPAGGFGEGELSAISEKMEPGIIEELNEGEDIKFAAPPTAGDYDSFSKATLRKVASGLGITYEALTSDYSNSNFSQSRMAERIFNKNVHVWRWNYFIPIVLDQVWDWFNEAAITEGAAKNLYPANWTPPKRELLNPKEDNDSDISSIRGGLSTWSEVIRSRGKDPEEMANEMASDNARFDKLGIIIDSDARKVMKAGIMQQPTAAELIDENTK
jgi:lambda family phage portal protein